MNRKLVIGTVITLAIIVILVIVLVIMNYVGPRQYSYDPEDYVTLAKEDYMGLPYKYEEQEVTDDEVETEINTRLKEAAKTENVTEGTVEDGDTVNIAFEGRIDGQTFDGGSSDSYDLTIGQTSMIEGFVEGLIGQEVGATVTEDLTFPDPYTNNPDLAGKPVTFTITIKSKKVTSTPELDETFVKANSDYDTVDEYRQSVRTDLLDKKNKDQKTAAKSSMWQYITDKAEISDYPDEEVSKAQKEADKMEQSYKDQAGQYGLQWEDFLSQMMGSTEEDFQKQLEGYRNNLVESRLTLNYLSEKLHVRMTAHEYKKKLQELLKDNGYTEQSFKSSYGMTIEEYGEEYDMRSAMLLDKILDKLYDRGRPLSEDEYNEWYDEHGPQPDEDGDADTSDSGDDASSGADSGSAD